MAKRSNLFELFFCVFVTECVYWGTIWHVPVAFCYKKAGWCFWWRALLERAFGICWPQAMASLCGSTFICRFGTFYLHHSHGHRRFRWLLGAKLAALRSHARDPRLFAAIVSCHGCYGLPGVGRDKQQHRPHWSHFLPGQHLFCAAHTLYAFYLIRVSIYLRSRGHCRGGFVFAEFLYLGSSLVSLELMVLVHHSDNSASDSFADVADSNISSLMLALAATLLVVTLSLAPLSCTDAEINSDSNLWWPWVTPANQKRRFEVGDSAYAPFAHN